MFRFGKSIWNLSVRPSEAILGAGLRKKTAITTTAVTPFIISKSHRQYSSLSSVNPIFAKMNHFVIPVSFHSAYYSTTTGQRQYSNEPLITPRPSGPEEGDKPPTTITGKLKAFFKKYGKLGFFVYFSISAISISSIYFTLRSGVDVKALLERIGLPEGGIFNGAGTLAVTYAIYKILLPVRLFLTVALTSWIAKRTRWGIPPSVRGSGERKR